MHVSVSQRFSGDGRHDWNHKTIFTRLRVDEVGDSFDDWTQ